MRLLEANPRMTQRDLARELGISLGGLNYCLKALVEKGWIKMENFSKSDRKLRYAYLLTPKGMAGKARLTNHFLRRKLAEYEALKEEIERLRAEAAGADTGSQ
ncbi:Transcriptional regulator, MarR family [Pseudohaliea rubra DSM 19751]|uniref:Transcriptional regulator, MarR family n=2 Tax=Pseudohaliea TaxID=1341120 RepID=A0A095VR16_9GAMM|nr:Transcriptional regulator, MarR family [Pseudohaliea rubra DSM 19751]